MKNNEDSKYADKSIENMILHQSEIPYSLPENWKWTKLGYAFKWGSGGTPSRNKPEFYTGKIPWVKTGELNNGILYNTEEKITEEAVKNSSAKIFPIDSVLIAMYGATIGKVAVLGVEAATNQACACALPSKYIESKYLFYYAMSQKENFINKGKGGAQPNISQEIIKQHPFPLAPKEEQKRIVQRIEDLFIKLDFAKEIIQNSVDSFNLLQASILYKAFSGELTSVWRTENNINISSWKKIKLSDILSIVKDKFDPDKDTMQYKYIGLEHIEKGNGIIGHSSSDVVKSLKSKFRTGDILYGKLRPYLNKHDIVHFDGICSTDILVYRSESETTSKYINYLMDTKEFIEYAVSNSKGINLPRVSGKIIGNFLINLPTIEEQKIITDILDSNLQNISSALKIKSIIENIESIEKSILEKAFRGELGTNNSIDEEASKILKSLSEDKTATFEVLPAKIRWKELVKMKYTILELLNKNGEMTPEDLKRETDLEIDAFYDQLKELIETGKISEKRYGEDVFLEAK